MNISLNHCINKPDQPQSRRGRLASALACLTLATSLPLCSSADEPLSLHAELSAGLEYTSSLNVQELDRELSSSDSALVSSASAGGRWQASDRLRLGADYRLEHSAQRRFEQFDQTLHLASLQADYDLAGYTLGASHHYAHARLDDDALLDLQRNSVSLARLYDHQHYLRLAFTDQDKQFANARQRDSDGWGVDLDYYRFFHGGRSHLNLGISREQEDARAAELDYHAWTWRLQAATHWRVGALDSRLQAGLRWSERDYDSLDPSLGERRDERRQTAYVSWELPLGEHLALDSRVEHGDHASNLATADYDQTRASLTLKASF